MEFLNSKTKRTRVSNIIRVNHAGATLISEEQYSQGGPKVVVLEVGSQDQQDGHPLSTCYKCTDSELRVRPSHLCNKSCK